MAAPKKGTATPLGAVFSPEETKRAVARVSESIADRRAELGRLQGFVADNAALVSLVNRLPDELSHEIMVPFGGAAFFPGRLIHTNELLVLLGEGYYAERSAKQTTDILHRWGVELEAQVEAMKATISDLEAEAKFFESTAAEASEGLVEIREEYDEDPESNSSKDASVATGGMSDKDKEHARIMARLDDLEMEEREAGSTSEEEDDDDRGAGTSEDGEENEESGNALSDGNEHQSSSFGTSFSRNGGDDDDDEDDGGAGTREDDEGNEVSGNALSDGNDHPSSSFGTSFSGSDGHDRSHGNIQLKSALQKPGGISHTPSAHTSHPITNSEVRVRKAVSFEDDKHVVGSSKSPSLPLDPPYPAPGFKGSSDLPPSRERKIISSGRQAFTGSIIERDDNLLPIQPPGGSSLAKPGTSASSRPMSRFKMQMQKGER
ncbi:unconventional prefoldin RPB5 interactor [Panicum miliaceum]|uniref:Unconventional prefoldin RPB5 interactor n=1 Tax=Panicum miliaceum TaxID=4540 RepID=A0A3L6PN92_PANMI|nr:unconventional prefoldin RPB5 interactor [Panicum miliaceum]